MTSCFRSFVLLALCGSNICVGATCWPLLKRKPVIPSNEYILKRLVEVLGGPQATVYYGHRDPMEAQEKVEVAVRKAGVEDEQWMDVRLVGSYASDWVMERGDIEGDVVLRPKRLFIFRMTPKQEVSVFEETSTTMKVAVVRKVGFFTFYDELKLEHPERGSLRFSLRTRGGFAFLFKQFSMTALALQPMVTHAPFFDEVHEFIWNAR